MLQRSLLAANALALCGITWSCVDDDDAGPELPDVEVRYRTKYVDLAPLSADPVCAGTLAMMDAYVEYTLGTLELATDRRIQMYLQSPGDPRPATWCSETWAGQRAEGCYWDERDLIFTNYQAMAHELVHAITDEVGNDSWWVEGAARALSHAPPLHADFSPGWSDLRGADGHLSRWLIEQYGGGVYMTLYAGTRPRAAHQAAVEAAVREVVGIDFDDLLSEYAATAPYDYFDPWLCYVPPDLPEVAWRDDVWDTEVTLDCDRPDTFSFGGDVARRTLSARVPVTIPNDGIYQFVADSDDAELFIQPCHREPRFDEPAVGPGDRPIPAASLTAGGNSLEAGPHVLIVDLPPDKPTTVRLKGYATITL